MNTEQPVAQQLNLVAGQSCHLWGTAVVTIALFQGTLEISGVCPLPNVQTRFDLGLVSDALILSTTSGANFLLSNESQETELQFQIFDSWPVLQSLRDAAIAFARRPVDTSSVVLFIHLCSEEQVNAGMRDRFDKVNFSRFFTNILLPSEDYNASPSKVFLSARSHGPAFVPGCISASAIHSSALSFGSQLDNCVPVVHFLGCDPSPINHHNIETCSLVLHTFANAVASAEALLESLDQETDDSTQQHRTLIIDTPDVILPDEIHDRTGFTTASNLIKQLVETAKPTDVFVSGTESNRIVSFLKLDRGVSTENTCSMIDLSSSPNEESLNRTDDTSFGINFDQKLEQYFCGDATNRFMCARVILSVSDISFHELVSDRTEGLGVIKAVQRIIASNTSWDECEEQERSFRGRVCAVSTAVIADEVPYAPIVGLLLIESLHIKDNELMAFVPSGTDSLPGSHLILSQQRYNGSFLLEMSL